MGGFGLWVWLLWGLAGEGVGGLARGCGYCGGLAGEGVGGVSEKGVLVLRARSLLLSTGAKPLAISSRHFQQSKISSLFLLSVLTGMGRVLTPWIPTAVLIMSAMCLAPRGRGFSVWPTPGALCQVSEELASGTINLVSRSCV